MLAVLSWAALPVEVFSQEHAVQGFVADAVTLALIPLATVTLVATDEETQSGPDGGFAFDDVPTGPITVRIEAPGYRGALWETEVVEGRPLFLEVLLSRLEGDSALRLFVTDQESGGPVAGAQALLPELSVTAVTDQNGEALVSDIPSGRWLVVVSGLGYGSATSFIDFDGATMIEGEVALADNPIELDGIVVTADRRDLRMQRVGFNQREQMGLGRFIDRAMIEEENPLIPSDLFRTMPGILRHCPESYKCTLSNRRGASLGSADNCGFQYYLDGIPWQATIDDINVDWIEGIEVYNGLSQVPAGFNATGGACGIILIWTRF